MQIFTLAEVALWLNLPVILSRLPVQSVVTDSREVQGGELFVALKGERTDGHTFLEEVASKGAIAALVANDYQDSDYGLTLIRVPDVLAALQEMAKKRLSGVQPKIIGVTGSVGKTTTKEFIATLLSKRYRVGKSPGNANSQVGVPKTILNIRGDEEVLVLEMGMTEAGQISRLIEMAPPDIAVITTIGHAHMEFFPEGMEGIAAAKAEIYAHPLTQWGVANIRTKEFPSVLASGCCQKLFVGTVSESDWKFSMEEEGIRLETKQGISPCIQLPFSASHLVEDFALAAAVASLFGISFEEIASQSKELATYKNRYEILNKEGVLFLNDSYNASPESMCAALDNLPTRHGKVIGVFGEMKELGRSSVEAHRKVALHALDKIDYLLCFGKGCIPMVEVFSSFSKSVELFRDFTLLKRRVYELAEEGDLVLLKGANSCQLWKVLDHEESVV
ncbi:MAG: UDP-N-acetylmuramoyl-tripeptide--D-alanyl-D-alanine ligase [Simkania sp.]|nr:UDP-N-acetylmuramoyl-tripeptide--D-alanyl-D-alanine ligase [Simkania sp.]